VVILNSSLLAVKASHRSKTALEQGRLPLLIVCWLARVIWTGTDTVGWEAKKKPTSASQKNLGSPYWKHSELFFEKKALITALHRLLYKYDFTL